REGRRGEGEVGGAEAVGGGEGEAETELARIGEPPWSAEKELAAQTLVDRYGGYFHRRPSFTWAALRAMAYGYAAPWEIPGFIRANNLSLEAMNRELLALDLNASLPRIAVPLFFFLA